MKFPFPTSPSEAGGSPAIGFYSPQPGSGATTLACMTALVLAEAGKDVALADFSPGSKVRTYMGLTTDVCPSSVLDCAGVKDASEIRRAGVEHPRSLFVIPGVARALDAAQLDSVLVSKTVCFLRRQFGHTVVVLPPLCGAGWAGAIVCDAVCVVVRPDRADLDCYRDHMELLSRLGCGERTRVILNQSRAPGSLRDEEIAEILKPDLLIPYEPAVRAMCNKRYIDTRFKKQLEEIAKGAEA